ncbi:MAG TPA: hypothetical protein VNW46_19185 [Gemmatimonadaceae bacterium]|nr:hypothetical protein [Gemmatimonadaceae bacterium]
MPCHPAPTIADIVDILFSECERHSNPLTARTPDGDRLRHEAAQCLQRTARRMRAVAALATADPAHRHEQTRIITGRPTRCAWCARRIFAGSVASLIDSAILHASCGAEFHEFVPNDLDQGTTTAPLGLTPESTPCP